MSLQNKVILVTGAAGLLGREVVKMLLSEGAQVIASDIKNEILKSNFSFIDEDILTRQIDFLEMDLLNEKSVCDFFAKVECLDGVVNCSYPRNKNYGQHFFDVSLDSFADNVTKGVGASFLLMQQSALFFKRKQAPFSLVNVASIYGVSAPDFSIYDNTPMTMPVEYSAIKSAIIHLNKYAVQYVSDSKFRVNSVSPGGLFDHQPEAFLQQYKSKTHGTGMLNAEDISGAIKFLLSEESQFITGQNIVIDDGFTL